MKPLLEVPLVALALAAGLGLLAWLGARLHWPAELRRKAVHVALGLGCAAFPWLFASPAPVWALAGLSAAGLGFLRLRALRGGTLGSALHGVERPSWGELVFPLAVALVFHASEGHWELYTVPVLVLALADASGALVGRRWGRHPLRMDGAHKSLEGSVAVFLFAALCVALPLAAFAGWTWPLALAAALLAAGLAALVEGVAQEGLDNLFLPLLTFAVLARAETWEPAGLLARAAILVFLLGGAALAGRRLTALSDAGLMGVVLALYLFVSLGGLVWLGAPLALTALYLVLCRLAPDRGAGRRHPLAAVVAIASAPLAWLTLAPQVSFGAAHTAVAAQAVLMLLAERDIKLHRDEDTRWLLQALFGAAVSVAGFFLFA